MTVSIERKRRSVQISVSSTRSCTLVQNTLDVFVQINWGSFLPLGDRGYPELVKKPNRKNTESKKSRHVQFCAYTVQCLLKGH